MPDTILHTTAQLWQLVSEVPDPEVPVLTIADLGVLRNVEMVNGKAIITITPTYSGCPAMDMISMGIRIACWKTVFSTLKSRSFFPPPGLRTG